MTYTLIETHDYHAPQFDGDGGYCDSKNCAAGSGAMAVSGGTGGRVRLTADQFRTQSGVSCVPGRDTPSGGLRFSDVSRVAQIHGVAIDYGWVEGKGYTRWAPATLALRCSQDWGAVLPGEYGGVPYPYRAPTSFEGGHSVRVHDFRASTSTYCWHDPLRKTGIRVPSWVVNSFWQATSPLRGIVGFYREVAPPTPPTPSTTTGGNVTIEYASVTSTANKMRLGGGQRLYESPGGKVVTRMIHAAAVPHVGLAGKAGGETWRAVIVGTGIPYEDGKVRKTVLYVPASAGTVVAA